MSGPSSNSSLVRREGEEEIGQVLRLSKKGTSETMKNLEDDSRETVTFIHSIGRAD